MMQRTCTYFSGRVQGVGFRYTARNLALQYDVRGYVRNLPDGRVELILEGPEQEINGLLGDLREKMGPFITHADVCQLPATGEFSQFSIRP